MQQDFKDFEFIIVDNGSTDTTFDVAMKYSDTRIRLYKNEKNLGLTKTLNRAISSYSKGCYIARLDAGDTCEPDRLSLQQEYLSEHPTCVLVGSRQVAVYDSDGDFVGYYRYPEKDKEIRRSMHQGISVLVHSSVMMRRDAFIQVGGYDERFLVAQDFDLWIRLLEVGEAANLPFVTSFFISRGISITKRNMQKELTKYALQKNLLAKKGRTFRSVSAVPIPHTANVSTKETGAAVTLERYCLNVSLYLGNKEMAIKWLNRSPAPAYQKLILTAALKLYPRFILGTSVRSLHCWLSVLRMYFNLRYIRSASS